MNNLLAVCVVCCRFWGKTEGSLLGIVQNHRVIIIIIIFNK